jgi:hypothetical protein
VVDEAAEMVSEGSPVAVPRAEVASVASTAKPRVRTKAAQPKTVAPKTVTPKVAASASAEADGPAKPAARTRRSTAKTAEATAVEKKPATPRKRAVKPAAAEPAEDA